MNILGGLSVNVECLYFESYFFLFDAVFSLGNISRFLFHAYIIYTLSSTSMLLNKRHFSLSVSLFSSCAQRQLLNSSAGQYIMFVFNGIFVSLNFVLLFFWV